MDHLCATEAVCRRLFSLAVGGWHGGPEDAASEQEYNRTTGLDACSASDLGRRLPWLVVVGVQLGMVLLLLTAPCTWAVAPCVAVGEVGRRVGPQPAGM
jgi:hypothetical protein